MASTTYKKIEATYTEDTNLKGAFLKRRVYNIGSTIPLFSPFVNAGWNSTDECLNIRLPNKKDDIIMGIMLTTLEANTFGVVKYVANGVITGIDTSSFEINNFLYAKTDGTFTTNPADDPDHTIPQELGLVIRKDSVNGEVYVSTVASQVRYLKLAALAIIEANSAVLGSNTNGSDIALVGGDGDGTGNGGDVIFEPGLKGSTGEDGAILIKKAGTLKSAGYYIKILHDGVAGIIRVFVNNILSPLIHLGKLIIRYTADTDGSKQIEISHNGTDAIFESKTGNIITKGTRLRHQNVNDYLEFYHNGSILYLYTNAGAINLNNIPLQLGTAIPEGKNIKLNDLTGNQIVEVDPSTGNLKSVAKNSAYNKNFGNAAGTVCEGNDSRLSDTRIPTDNSVTSAKMSSNLPTNTFYERQLRIFESNLQEKTRTWTITNGIVTAISEWSTYQNVNTA